RDWSSDVCSSDLDCTEGRPASSAHEARIPGFFTPCRRRRHGGSGTVHPAKRARRRGARTEVQWLPAARRGRDQRGQAFVAVHSGNRKWRACRNVARDQGYVQFDGQLISPLLLELIGNYQGIAFTVEDIAPWLPRLPLNKRIRLALPRSGRRAISSSGAF